MTTLTTTVRSTVAVNRTLIASATFVAFGLADILLFGLFHTATRRSRSPSTVRRWRARPCAARGRGGYALGAVSIAIGVLRATVPLSRAGRRACIAGRPVLHRLAAVLG